MFEETEKELELHKFMDLVDYVSNVLDDNLRDEVLEECNALGLRDYVRKTEPKGKVLAMNLQRQLPRTPC